MVIEALLWQDRLNVLLASRHGQLPGELFHIGHQYQMASSKSEPEFRILYRSGLRDLGKRSEQHRHTTLCRALLWENQDDIIVRRPCIESHQHSRPILCCITRDLYH